MFRLANFAARSHIVFISSILVSGCVGLPKFSSIRLLEEQWNEFDRLEKSISIVAHKKEGSAPSDLQKTQFTEKACLSEDINEISKSCAEKLGILMSQYYSGPDLTGIESIGPHLTGLAYQASTCSLKRSEPFSKRAILALRLSLQFDPVNIKHARIESFKRLNEEHDFFSDWVPNDEEQENQEFLLRRSANTAINSIRDALALLVGLEDEARYCKTAELRGLLAAEIHSAIGYFNAQDPMTAVKYTLFESGRDIPPAYKADFSEISRQRDEIASRMIGRYELRSKILSWASHGKITGQPLVDDLKELTDLMYGEARNSDMIANELYRSHWAHQIQTTGGEPVALSLAQGAKAVSENSLKSVMYKNSCTGKSLSYLSKAVAQVDDVALSEENIAKTKTLVEKAKLARETLTGCDRSSEDIFCVSVKPGSREYYRVATSSIISSIDASIANLENTIGSLSSSDIQTKRNIITAKLIAGLRLLLKSVDAPSACHA